MPQARVLLIVTSFPTSPITSLAPGNFVVPVTGNLTLLEVFLGSTGLKGSSLGSAGITGFRSTVTLFHLAGFNLSKQHEITSYVEAMIEMLK